jgi:hypothetical protein
VEIAQQFVRINRRIRDYGFEKERITPIAYNLLSIATGKSEIKYPLYMKN